MAYSLEKYDTHRRVTKEKEKLLSTKLLQRPHLLLKCLHFETKKNLLNLIPKDSTFSHYDLSISQPG